MLVRYNLLYLAIGGLALVQSPALAAPPHQSTTSPVTFSATDTGNGLWEVAVAGTRFTSRDDIEGRLLLETARLAQSRKMDWFVLVARPGEGTGMHPARPIPTFGAQYKSWHAQWFYRVDGDRWQTWRPEWGAPFWSDSLKLGRLKEFESHALVQLGTGPPPEESDMFGPTEVIRDLTSLYAPQCQRIEGNLV